jgi:uncharacterized membrane protein
VKWLRGATIHLVLGLVWVVLLVPTVLAWKDSILWVAFMSLYANVAGHWSAYQAARTEREVKTSGDG